MAIFRKIHTSFWSDPFIQDLDNDHRLFYLYLLTNERTKQCGIYEISKKQMSFELGYSIDKVSKLLAYFIKVGKILYSETTKEVALKNWMKYNGSTSPKVVSCIKSELCSVKDRVLIEYVNGMYTASQEEQEEEEEKEEEQEKKFKKPTIEEIALYMEEKGMNNVAERFYNFYEAKGWMIGKNAIKNWKACVITWKDGNLKIAAPVQTKPIKYFNIEDYDK
jgi:hypothetical protein